MNEYPFINTWPGIPVFYNKRCRIIKELPDDEVRVEFERGATLTLRKERLLRQEEDKP